jgi:hypothetical protein
MSVYDDLPWTDNKAGRPSWALRATAGPQVPGLAIEAYPAGERVAFHSDCGFDWPRVAPQPPAMPVSSQACEAWLRITNAWVLGGEPRPLVKQFMDEMAAALNEPVE